MTKLAKLLLVIITFFILINNGCKKERKPVEINVPQELKDWMFFDTGTWWVYKEKNSGQLDSQYVTKTEIKQRTSPNIKGEPYEKVESLYVYLNNLNYLVFTSVSCKLNRLTNGESKHTFLVFFPLKVGEGRYSCGVQDGFIKITDIQGNFTLDNKYYNTKMTVLDPKDCTENEDSVQYQILKGVGIINKKNITKNEEWQLIKYHINLNKN